MHEDKGMDRFGVYLLIAALLLSACMHFAGKEAEVNVEHYKAHAKLEEAEYLRTIALRDGPKALREKLREKKNDRQLVWSPKRGEFIKYWEE